MGDFWGTLAVQADARRLVVRVIDNGNGLPAELREDRGLRNMHLRAERIGGQWSMACTPEGCTVRLELACPPNAEAAVRVAGPIPTEPRR